MQTERIKEERVLIRIKKTDSMGRTAEVRKAMEANDPRPIKLDDDTLFIHDTVAEACSEFPKAMYRLALRNGKPAGDEAAPSYPMPFDLAQQLGLDTLGFKVIGKNRDSAGNVVVRLPYITRMVGVLNPDMTVDVQAARAEEARLRKLGWVDSPSKIKGLPVPSVEQPFDELPEEDSNSNGSGLAASASQNQSQARTIKEAVGPDTATQPAALAAGTPPVDSPAESNPNQRIKPARGGRRPGAGRKPKIAMAR